MRYLITLILCVNIAFAQCPPSTWGLDITLKPDQYPEETSWAIINFNGDTLLQGGPYLDIIDYQPQYAQVCAPIDTFIISTS